MITPLLLPTYLLSSLQLEITYAAPSATNYGSNPPSTFATDVTTRITCVEGIPEAGEDFSSNPLMTVLNKNFDSRYIKFWIIRII